VDINGKSLRILCCWHTTRMSILYNNISVLSFNNLYRNHNFTITNEEIFFSFSITVLTRASVIDDGILLLYYWDDGIAITYIFIKYMYYEIKNLYRWFAWSSSNRNMLPWPTVFSTKKIKYIWVHRTEIEFLKNI